MSKYSVVNSPDMVDDRRICSCQENTEVFGLNTDLMSNHIAKDAYHGKNTMNDLRYLNQRFCIQSYSRTWLRNSNQIICL